jgi:hypothetical protein
MVSRKPTIVEKSNFRLLGWFIPSGLFRPCVKPHGGVGRVAAAARRPHGHGCFGPRCRPRIYRHLVPGVLGTLDLSWSQHSGVRATELCRFG